LGPYLRGLAVDARGYVYVAASGDGRVLLVTPDGKATTKYQAQTPWSPTAVALHGRTLYVLEYRHAEGDDRRVWLPRVRRIEAGVKSTIIATVAQMPGARR
ncbi:MAG: SMP-30/gluconolactonase/LRE family protein, partial [Fimbriimonadaceae bacterium]